jgi:hypothetical protein
MPRSGKLTVVLLSAMLFACSGIEVKQDYDTAADFSSLKRYAWLPEQRPQDGEQVENSELVNNRIREAVDAVLADNGYRRSDRSQADFLVGYYYKVRQRTETRDRSRTGVGVGMGTGSRGSFGSIGIGIGLGGRDREYNQGMLTIDVINPRDNKLMWRGMAEQRLIWDSNPRKTTQRINETVAAVLAKFPPKR